MKNYYSILEIHFQATEIEIKKAYRKCALKYHPDVNRSPDAHTKFLEVFEAYEVLSNPIERKIYDELYVKTFMNRSMTVYTANEQYKQRNETNRQKATQKAETYSKMSYSSFANYLSKELNLALDHVFPIGWAIFLLAEGAASNFIIFFALSDKDLSNQEGAGMGILFLVIMGIVFFVWGWNQFQKAKKNYLDDRKQTFK